MTRLGGERPRVLVLAVGGALGFWLANFAISLTPLAADYRAALSIAYLPMLLEALLGGLIIGTCVSYCLLHFFDKIPTNTPMAKSLPRQPAPAERRPRQRPEVLCLVRRAFMRNCVTRATPAMATTTPPPTAAISNAIPRGMVPDMPRNWTSTSVEFWRMKTISRISSRSATLVATQVALTRVTRAARRGGRASRRCSPRSPHLS